MFAMERGPENFRDIKWGTDIEGLSDMIIVNENKFEKMCERKDEILTIGKASVQFIRYFFYEDKFYSVYISFLDKENFNYLREYLFNLYGQPDRSRKLYTYYWFGKEVDISFRYNHMLGFGSLTYDYLPISDQLKKELTEE